MSLYCWGLSRSGQAGQTDDKTGKVIIPSKVSIKPSQHGNILDVGAGGLYTAAITDKNVLVTFGCGKYGRLGNGSEDDQHTPCFTVVQGAPLLKVGLWNNP